MGWRHSIEVAFVLPTQLARIRILALLRFFLITVHVMELIPTGQVEHLDLDRLDPDGGESGFGSLGGFSNFSSSRNYRSEGFGSGACSIKL